MSETQADQDQKVSRPRAYLTFWGLLACALTTTVVIIGVGGYTIMHMVDVKFLTDVACQDFGPSKFVPKFTYCFYDEEWDSETYLAAITSFYTTLITVLIALQALISWVSFIVIRNSNKQEIESEVEKELPNFFRNKNSDTVIKEALQDNMKREVLRVVKDRADSEDEAVDGLQDSVYNQVLPQLTDIKAEIEQLDVRMRKLARKIQNGEVAEADDEVGRLQE